jgi:hypothetical protein
MERFEARHSTVLGASLETTVLFPETDTGTIRPDSRGRLPITRPGIKPCPGETIIAGKQPITAVVKS